MMEQFNRDGNVTHCYNSFPQSLTSEFLMKQKLQMSYHISARAMNTKDAIVDRSRVRN